MRSRRRPTACDLWGLHCLVFPGVIVEIAFFFEVIWKAWFSLTLNVSRLLLYQHEMSIRYLFFLLTLC